MARVCICNHNTTTQQRKGCECVIREGSEGVGLGGRGEARRRRVRQRDRERERG